MSEIDVKRDPNIDVQAMLGDVTGSETTTKPAGEQSTLASLMSNSKPVEAKKPVEEDDPLAAAIKNKKNSGGFEGTMEEEDHTLRPLSDTDERRAELEEKAKELDMNILRAKAVVGILRPADKLEYTEMMGQLEQVQVDPETGRATYVPESKYFVARTDAIDDQIEKIKAGEILVDEDGNPLEGDNIPKYEDGEEYFNGSKKDNLVRILIDKTGLGANLPFDVEEKTAIMQSNMIHLVEVDTQELRSVEMDRVDSDMSFFDAVDKYQMSLSKVPMTFPGSGFKADMTGMSFAEYNDIALDPGDNSNDFISFERVNRRMAVVYNHMVNASCGKFESYEDFLKKFAYIDISLAVYGLAIATEPEITEIGMQCRVDHCKRTFNHSFSPRSIIDFESASPEYLEKLEAINTCPPDKRVEMAENSAVRRQKRFELPQSKWLVDFRLMSCYDYLYKELAYIDSVRAQMEDMEEDDPELPKIMRKLELIDIVQAIGMISIPSMDGGPMHYYSSPDGITEAILHMPPSDVAILSAAFRKYISAYFIDFNLKKVVCPHCGHSTAKTAITPDQLVFRMAQRLLNTDFRFDNLQAI